MTNEVDITPSWVDWTRYVLSIYPSLNYEGRKLLEKDFLNMARLADLYKESKNETSWMLPHLHGE